MPVSQLAAPIGLLDAFEQVSLKLKTVAPRPAAKLVELLVHILAGGMRGKELAAGPRPWARDQAVARAGGPEAFASASGRMRRGGRRPTRRWPASSSRFARCWPLPGAGASARSRRLGRWSTAT